MGGSSSSSFLMGRAAFLAGAAGAADGVFVLEVEAGLRADGPAVGAGSAFTRFVVVPVPHAFPVAVLADRLGGMLLGSEEEGEARAARDKARSRLRMCESEKRGVEARGRVSSYNARTHGPPLY